MRKVSKPGSSARCTACNKVVTQYVVISNRCRKCLPCYHKPPERVHKSYSEQKALKQKKKKLKKSKYLKQLQSKQSVLSGYQKTLKKKSTKSERLFRNILKLCDVKFIEQKGWIKGQGFYISDFYLPDFKCSIEIDGAYHNLPERQQKDRDKEQYLLNRRVHTLRIKNEQVPDIMPEHLIGFLAQIKGTAKKVHIWV